MVNCFAFVSGEKRDMSMSSGCSRYYIVYDFLLFISYCCMSTMTLTNLTSIKIDFYFQPCVSWLFL